MAVEATYVIHGFRQLFPLSTVCGFDALFEIKFLLVKGRDKHKKRVVRFYYCRAKSELGNNDDNGNEKVKDVIIFSALFASLTCTQKIIKI